MTIHAEDEDFDLEAEESDPESQRYWGKWFHRYAVSQPQALQRITLEPYYADITNNAGPETGWEPKSEWDKYQEMLKQLRNTPDYTIFPYAHIEDKYGMLFEQDISDMRWALRGADMLGWEGISEVMERNRQRIAEETSANPLD